jgi:hypothetical protein
MERAVTDGETVLATVDIPMPPRAFARRTRRNWNACGIERPLSHGGMAVGSSRGEASHDSSIST